MTRFVCVILVAALGASALPASDAEAALALAAARRAGKVEAEPKAPCACDGCKCLPNSCPLSCPVAADPALSTVKVSHDMGGGATGHGTGVVVQSDADGSLVLTNKHVAPTPGRYVVSQAGKTYAAEWLGVCRTNDLALLRVATKLPAVALADAEPQAGTAVVLWGHPHGGPLRKLVGRVLGREGSFRSEDGGQVYGVLINTVQGDSGAGLFDSSGRLVAVNWGGNPGKASMVPLGDVKVFLTAAGAKAKAPAAPATTSPLTLAHESLDAGRPAVLTVAAGQYPGIPAGTYDCFVGPDGRHLMRARANPFTLPAGGCANGRCPLQR